MHSGWLEHCSQVLDECLTPVFVGELHVMLAMITKLSGQYSGSVSLSLSKSKSSLLEGCAGFGSLKPVV